MLLELPLNLATSSAAHIPNWDLIADVVNSSSRTFRYVIGNVIIVTSRGIPHACKQKLGFKTYAESQWV